METRPVAQLLSRFWWMILLRGVLAVVFGISAFAWPGLTLVTLTMLFAAFAFVDGIFEVLHAIAILISIRLQPRAFLRQPLAAL